MLFQTLVLEDILAILPTHIRIIIVVEVWFCCFPLHRFSILFDLVTWFDMVSVTWFGVICVRLAIYQTSHFMSLRLVLVGCSLEGNAFNLTIFSMVEI